MPESILDPAFMYGILWNCFSQLIIGGNNQLNFEYYSFKCFCQRERSQIPDPNWGTMSLVYLQFWDFVLLSIAQISCHFLGAPLYPKPSDNLSSKSCSPSTWVPGKILLYLLIHTRNSLYAALTQLNCPHYPRWDCLLCTCNYRTDSSVFGRNKSVSMMRICFHYSPCTGKSM